MPAEATPKAEERAEELGVDIQSVEGSGQDGRVTVGDVEAAAKESDADAPMEPTADNAEMPASDPPPEMFEVRINPDTGLLGYDFGDGFGLQAGDRPMISEDDFAEYKKVKHNGEQVLVKR